MKCRHIEYKSLLNKHSFVSLTCYLILSLQSFSLLSVSGISLKLYHFFFPSTAIIFLVLFRKFNKSLSFPIICILLLVFISLVDILTFKFNPLVLNYIFGISILLFFSNKRFLDYDAIIIGLQCGALIILIASLVNIALNFNEIRIAQQASVVLGIRPDLPYIIYGGGLNLESTWIGLASLFFIKNRNLYLFYLALALIVSMSFLSRIGMITIVLSFSFWCLYHNIYKKPFFLAGCIAFITVSFLIMLSKFGSGMFTVLERFEDIGNEPGSQGRLYIWSFVWDAFIDRPLLGYGAGNAIEAVKEFGYDRNEDNVHNYFFQALLDFGVIGLLIIITLFINFIIKTKKMPELRFYFLLFGIISMVQFRGAEPLVFMMLAIGYTVNTEGN